jgi:uncharacterized protein YbjT (DUF2867 family)
MILVTGATGTIGPSVVAGLIDGGMEFRATTRRDALLGSEQFLVRMDLADRDSVVAALAGVDVVFLNSSQHPEMAAHQGGLIDAAAETGVRHIVKVSAGSAATGPDKPSWVGRAHAAIEARLEASGLGWTVLRPNYFMQNLLGLAPAISEGTLPMALDEHRLAPVDARDIAAAATAVLRDPLPHHARVYEMTGPESLTPADIADGLSAGVGRRVAHVRLTLEELRAGAARAGAPEWIGQHVVELMDLYARDESVGAVSPDVERLIGRAPSSLAKFVADHASTFGRAA